MVAGNWRLLLAALAALLACAPAAAAAPKRFPCDPKFGYGGNYVELALKAAIGTGDAVKLCFGDPAGEACLKLSTLPARTKGADGVWSEWRSEVRLDRGDTTYQFALCGADKDDLALWETFHKPLGSNAWDTMRLRGSTTGAVFVDTVRVVQNRVRILDGERADEGSLHMLLGLGGVAEIPLAERIRRTKLNRVACLNTHPGAPYCEEQVRGLNPRALPPVIERALLELGHSGSEKYGRADDAYCSEFALFIIEQGSALSSECTNVPDPSRGDLSARHLFRWLTDCGRLIPRDQLRSELKAGDYLSVNDRKHSTLFLGWADADKRFFWEISGNNQCRPEQETLYSSSFMSNMVCIAKREFDGDIRDTDFGGRTGH